MGKQSVSDIPTQKGLAPAYYAPKAGGWRRDIVALLHPPYTAWHLSYVLIGASLAPSLDLVRLAATLVAFFCAVGISAHALDELHGRPLRTEIPGAVLGVAAVAGLAGAIVLGLIGMTKVGVGLLPFIALGVLFVAAYNLELVGGRMHGDFWFALSWGAFPVLTAYFAQAGTISIAALLAAAAGYALSYGQRGLSTPARTLRRRTREVEGTLTLDDSSRIELSEAVLLRPLELALRAFSWGVVALAIGMVLSRVL